MHAERVTDQTEFSAFSHAWLDKYGSDRRDAGVETVYLYRLVSRDN